MTNVRVICYHQTVRRFEEGERSGSTATEAVEKKCFHIYKYIYLERETNIYIKELINIYHWENKKKNPEMIIFRESSSLPLRAPRAL